MPDPHVQHDVSEENTSQVTATKYQGLKPSRSRGKTTSIRIDLERHYMTTSDYCGCSMTKFMQKGDQ